MRYSLRSKLTLSYVIIVLIVVGASILIANTRIRIQFQDYVIQRQEKQTKEIIDLIKMKYEEDGEWDISYLESIGMNALQNGMIVEIKNLTGENVWSAYEHNNGMCQAMIAQMIQNMYNYSTDWNGDYQEESYSLVSKGKKIGTLTTGFVGPYYYTNEEIIFLKALNTLFLIIGGISLISAFALGIFMSHRISNPLDKIAKKALFLAEGKYKERLNIKSNMKEIGILTETINDLSEALEHKEKLRKQLTQDVAHELRTPLTSVQGHMEAMIDGIWEMDKDRLQSCYDEIIRIKKLIGNIEDLSGVENENLILSKKEFDLSKLIIRLLNNYESDFINKSLKVEYQAEKLTLYADEDKMSQVLNNLLSNAVKYTKEGDEIIIKANSVPNGIEISIKDSGVGISETDLPFIFERFYRADKSRNRQIEGVGVGLTITKAIVEAHGGFVQVESKLGEGTKFTVLLPEREKINNNYS